MMALVALVVLWLVAAGPSPAKTPPQTSTEEAAERRLAQRAVLRSPLLWSYGASYFFIKFTRYALALWLPFYLSEQLGYGVGRANAVASAFEGGGLLGVIALGALSDRLKLGRVLLSALSLLGLAVALLAATYWVGVDSGVALTVAALALVGAFLFAPDSILCGAAAQDAGGRNAAAMATGFVNGIGSVGALLEGLMVPLLAKHFGWQILFPSLVGMALLGALCLLPALRRPSLA